MRENRMLSSQKPIRSSAAERAKKSRKKKYRLGSGSGYTTDVQVRLALRAPDVGSWDGNVYDDLLEWSIGASKESIDDMCSEWSPFDCGLSTDDVVVVAELEATWGMLSTPPYKTMPTSIEVDGVEVDIKYKPYIDIEHDVGKSLEIEFNTRYFFIPGIEYTLKGGEWGFEEIPPGVRLAATRIAAKMFRGNRNTLGVVEVAGGSMYEPRYDSQVTNYLKRYISGAGI